MKHSDSRTECYNEDHGTTCWEVDVLPAAIIEAAIDAAIEVRLDAAVSNQRDREIERRAPCCDRSSCHPIPSNALSASSLRDGEAIASADGSGDQ